MTSMVNIKSFYITCCVVLLILFNIKGDAQSTWSFSYSGTAQTLTVPANVCCIYVKAWGGGGAGGGNDAYPGGVGGGGAYTESVIIVSPGDILTVYVGGAGMPGAGGAGTAGGSGGWGYGNGGNGGNAGPDCCSGSGGGAGGSSGVLLNGAPVIFAAGGGGAGGGGCKSAGGNGGAGGINGSATTCTSGGNTAGSGAPSGAAGQSHPADGGGGGGGGGGINGGQGGFAPPVGSSCNPSTDCGAGGGGGGGSWSSGNNTVITNGSGQTPGNNADPDFPAGSSTGGGNTAQGTSGFLKLDYYNPSNIGFTATSACYGAATQFTDNTISVVGTTTSWTWDFGDGGPVNTTQSPSHTYSSGGSYNVTLAVTNSLGCSNTLTKVVQVFYKPTANFTHSYVCAGFPMHFSNTSFVDNVTSITDYSWDFGDGTAISILQDPIHTFSLPGPYDISLVTTTADGCTDAITISIIIYDAPGSAFSFNNSCIVDSAHFTNTTTNPTLGTIASWFWDFGDGTPPNTSIWSPSHLYAFAGDYTVTLVTYSSNGCADTLKDTITIFMPHAYFGFADVCLNQVMNFSDLSSVTGGGTITSWTWDFGDASPANTNQNPSYTYTNAGTYTVTLIATSDIGCKDTISKSAVVHDLPNAEFLKTNVCDGSYAQFNDISTILSPDLIQGWSWTFGDGTTVNNQTTSHLYAALGSYQVQLLAVSNFGCKDSISKTLFVNPNPVLIFSANDTVGCEPLCISFQDLSSVYTGTNIQWSWNLGDGSVVNNSQNIDHCYANDSVFAPNFFDVTLTVTSDSGCVSTLSKNNYITVYPLPESNFAVQPEIASIIDPVISYIDLSIGANAWNWSFGDTATSFLFSPPQHSYADTGTYLITLTITNQYGCTDVDYHSIIIDPDFVFYIPNAFTPDGDGINDTFTGKGVFIKEFEMLIFDRWGDMIFKTTDIHNPWDGKANNGNEMAQRDVYVYAVTVTDLKMVKHRYKGIVTLVR